MAILRACASYTRVLVDIGYRDADARIDEIEEFLCGDADGVKARAAASS